jgi:hypothetical protein
MSEKRSSGDEIGEEESGWVALMAGADTFQDTVAVKLVHDQVGVQDTAGLQLVWNNAANEVGVSGVQGVHQLGQLLSVAR